MAAPSFPAGVYHAMSRIASATDYSVVAKSRALRADCAATRAELRVAQNKMQTTVNLARANLQTAHADLVEVKAKYRSWWNDTPRVSI